MIEAAEIVAGLLGGVALIAGALYLAIRPYLLVRAPKPWLPERSGRRDDTPLTWLDPPQ